MQHDNEQSGSFESSIPHSWQQVYLGKVALADDLRKLDQMTGGGFPECVAFYAGRVLEGTVPIALRKMGLQNGIRMSDSLASLSLCGTISDGVIASAQSIRRIANQARHLARAIQPDEELTILALLQLWMEWCATEFLGGGGHVFSNDWSPRTRILRELVESRLELLSESLSLSSETTAFLLADAATAAFVGERLTDCCSAAGDWFTEKALEQFPKDRRVLEVRSLFLSRNGRPQEAIEHLLPVTIDHYPDDEAFGILGGAYKNVWESTHDKTALSQSAHSYKEGIKRSPSNYYLLINAAATSLWLGYAEASKTFALRTLDALSSFGFTLDHALTKQNNYWLIATLAEAQLLSGVDIFQSIALYELARNADPTGGRWDRTLEQLRLHLDSLNDENLLAQFASITTEYEPSSLITQT